MMQTLWVQALLMMTLIIGLVSTVEAQPASAAPAPAPAPLDIVTLKDGSILYSEVMAMEGDIVFIKTPAGTIIVQAER